MKPKLKNDIIEHYNKAKRYLQSTLFDEAEIALIAGSGVSQSFISSDIAYSISYTEIPNFHSTGVTGHDGNLLLINHKHKKVMVFSGRFHLYEGLDVSTVVSPIILSYLLGIRRIILTNAAGGLNDTYIPGDLMYIGDYINFTYKDLSGVFDGFRHRNSKSDYQNNYNLFRRIYTSLTPKGIHLKYGTYAGVIGPNYETRSEIRMFRRLGADAVGMSTVLEAHTAELLGFQTIACSLITNKSKEIPQVVSHQEVVELAIKSKLDIREFIFSAIESFQ